MFFQDNRVFDETESDSNSSEEGYPGKNVTPSPSVSSSRPLTSRSASTIFRSIRLSIPETSKDASGNTPYDKNNTNEQYSILSMKSIGNDQHMDLLVLQRKLQSKTEAVHILRNQLEKFRAERDQFKLMAETLQLRFTGFRKYDYGASLSSSIEDNWSSSNDEGTESERRTKGFIPKSHSSTMSSILQDTREHNLHLTMEIELLKQKILDLQGDLKLLRSQRSIMRPQQSSYSSQSQSPEGSHSGSGSNSTESYRNWKEERSHIICQMEQLKQKCAHLSFDLRTIIDEKEELITERDAYKYKVNRISHELLRSLKANKIHPRFLDIDSVIMENDYLQERVKNVQSRLDVMNQTLDKYKNLLDSKRKKGIVKLSTLKTNHEQGVFLQKQIHDLIQNNIELPVTVIRTIEDLKSTCLILLDKLNDQNLAIDNQKQTNKILAKKNAQLEERLQKLSQTESDANGADQELNNFSPAKYLLEGYNPLAIIDEEKRKQIKVDKFTEINLPLTNPLIYIHEENDSSLENGKKDLYQQQGNDNNDENDNDAESESSFSSESEISIASSDYELNQFNLTEPALGALSEIHGKENHRNNNNLEFLIPFESAFSSNSTSAGSSGTRTSRESSQSSSSSGISDRLLKQRQEYLKNLPTEITCLVEQALRELDAQEFDFNLPPNSTNEE